MKKIISYLLCVVLLFSVFKFDSIASGTFSTFSGSMGGGWQYDDTLPSVESGQLNFYYKYASGKAWYTSDRNVAARMANNMGVIINPDSLLSVVQNFINHIFSLPTGGGAGWVYNSTGSVVGVAMNDLSGCTLSQANSGNFGTFDIPSTLSNEFYNNVNTQMAAIGPDFINIPTVTKSMALPYLVSGVSKYQETTSIVNNPPSDYLFCYKITNKSGYQNVFCGNIQYNDVNSVSDVGYIYSDSVAFGVNSSLFSDLVTKFSLSTDKNSISFSDWSSESISTKQLSFYDSSLQTVTMIRGNYTGSSSTSTYYHGYVGNSIERSSSDVYFAALLPFSEKGYFTIYSNISIPTQITNNVYAPTFRTSNKFYDYDSNSTNNNITVTNNSNDSQNIDNSVSNNQTIYNNSNTEINQNMSENNYSYNSSQSSTIINNIVNNYYGSSDNPDNPDNPDDDNWWDSIISAIGEFFSGLGRIVSEIIAGIIGIFTDVLNMIADLQVDISALQDFFQQIFGFFPPEIVSLISVSIGLMILICIIKALK